MQTTYTLAVAAEVRAEMGRQKWGHERLARALGVSRPFAARRINGQIPWDVAELEIIAETFGVPLAKFLFLPAAPEPAHEPAGR